MYEEFVKIYRKVVIDGRCRGECSPIPIRTCEYQEADITVTPHIFH